MSEIESWQAKVKAEDMEEESVEVDDGRQWEYQLQVYPIPTLGALFPRGGPVQSRANSYPWSSFPPRRARPGPGPLKDLPPSPNPPTSSRLTAPIFEAVGVPSPGPSNPGEYS